MKKMKAIGVASGLAAADRGCEKGSQLLEHSELLRGSLAKAGITLNWEQLFPKEGVDKLTMVSELAHKIAEKTKEACQEGEFPLVFGGDHSCAIGTWSGVAAALRSQGDLGLIWIDAHLDAHTHETSESGNIHGMPVAALLGFGDPALTQVADKLPKIKPEHLCFIGIRSYEPAERLLLEQLGVKIFYIEEVLARGVEVIMSEALHHVQKGTVAFGVSLDIDSVDPFDAPGTGTAVPGGIPAVALCSALTQIAKQSKLVAVEIAEFDPERDKAQKTEKWIGEFILCLTK